MECDICFGPAYGSMEVFIDAQPWGPGDVNTYLRSLKVNEWHRVYGCKDHLYQLVHMAEEVMDDPGLWHPDQQHPFLIGGGTKVRE